MSKRGDKLLLQDIYEAGTKILRYTKNDSYEVFLNDEKTVDAVIRNFEVIGEASKHLSEELVMRYPQVEWRKMMNFRNLLIHEYFGINYEIVWGIVQEYLPKNLEFIANMIKE